MKRLSTALLLLLLSVSVAAEEPARLELSIKGMDCGGCAKGIEAMLEVLEGVIKASVSFEASAGIVEYNPGKVTPEKIIGEIKDLGYKVTVKKQDTAESAN